MKRVISFTALIATAMVFLLPLQAQQPRKSPHETISRRYGYNLVTIVYGRPYTKDPKTGEPRKIWGGLVPFGKIWRLGADEATMLVLRQPITLGGVPIPAGAYTLFMFPESERSAKLIVNREIGQWGIDPYHKENELARIDLKGEPITPPAHQLTITLENGAPHGGSLKIAWEGTQYSAPIETNNGSAKPKDPGAKPE